jgi:hypothetical protein
LVSGIALAVFTTSVSFMRGVPGRERAAAPPGRSNLLPFHGDWKTAPASCRAPCSRGQPTTSAKAARRQAERRVTYSARASKFFANFSKLFVK